MTVALPPALAEVVSDFKEVDGHDKLKLLRRHYVGGAIECEIDKLGRLLLPSELREWGALERGVLWVGVGKRIELWDPARFRAENAVDINKPDSFAEMKARMTELGL